MINSCRICSCDIGKEQFSCSLSHTLFIYVVGKHEQKVKETTTGDNFEKKEKQLSQVLFQRRTYYSDTSQKKKIRIAHFCCANVLSESHQKFLLDYLQHIAHF